MEIVWLASAIEDFVSLLEKVDSLFGKAVATKVKYKISSHINLLASFPCMGMRDFYFSDDKYDVRYLINTYNPQIQISAESETKRSIFREKDKTKRSKKESAQHSKSRNKSFVMTSVSAL